MASVVTQARRPRSGSRYRTVTKNLGGQRAQPHIQAGRRDRAPARTRGGPAAYNRHCATLHGVSNPDREVLARLLVQVHDATENIDSRTDALALYREARDVAEQRIPGPLGVAVAAALAAAAYERFLSPIRNSSLGASKSSLALALAVLALPE